MAQDDHRQLTKTSSAELSSPSNASKAAGDRRRSVAALLNRLALHCPVRNLPEEQAALLMEDTIFDLMGYEPRQIADACTAWRRGDKPFFPTSGQLIALIPKRIFTAWDRPAYRAPKLLESPRGEPKPWRQVLAEKGYRVPQEPERPVPTPAEQEALDAAGALSEERRAQQQKLREPLRQRAPEAA